MALSDRRDSPLIFLSHSGFDARLANQFSTQIERTFSDMDLRLNVFNTSETQYRYVELTELLHAGNDWSAVASQYEKDLRAYLSDNLATSSAYLLLVTRRSAVAASDWVQWEAREGTALAREHGVPFVPCVAGVDSTSLYSPVIPPEVGEFEAVRFDIDKPEGLNVGVTKLARALRQDWMRRFEKGQGPMQT